MKTNTKIFAKVLLFAIILTLFEGIKPNVPVQAAVALSVGDTVQVNNNGNVKRRLAAGLSAKQDGLLKVGEKVTIQEIVGVKDRYIWIRYNEKYYSAFGSADGKKNFFNVVTKVTINNEETANNNEKTKIVSPFVATGSYAEFVKKADEIDNYISALEEKYRKASLYGKLYFESYIPYAKNILTSTQKYAETSFNQGFNGLVPYQYKEGPMFVVFNNVVAKNAKNVQSTMSKFASSPLISSSIKKDALKLGDAIANLRFESEKFYSDGWSSKAALVTQNIDNASGMVWRSNDNFNIADYVVSAVLVEKYNSVLKKYPLDSKITKTYFPLRDTAGNVLINRYFSSTTCFAYCSAAADLMFQMDSYSRDDNSYSIPLTEFSYEAFVEAGVKPFTFIRTTSRSDLQYSDSGHSFVILGFTEKNVLVADANRLGSNIIGVQCFSYEELQKNQLTEKGRYIQKALISNSYDQIVYGK